MAITEYLNHDARPPAESNFMTELMVLSKGKLWSYGNGNYFNDFWEFGTSLQYYIAHSY